MIDASGRALLALVAGAICIAFAPIFVRWIDVGYTAAAFWRVALALPLLWLLWYPRRKREQAIRRRNLPWLILAGVFFAADLAVWHQSIRYTSVANATLLANLAPVFVTAAAVSFFGERVSRTFVFGLLLAIVGSATLVAHSSTLDRQFAIGDLLGVAAAVFYACYLLGVSRMRKVCSAIEVMWWTTLACACTLLPMTLLLGETMFPQQASGWLVLLGLAVVSQFAGQGLITWAMATLPAAFSSVSLLLQPVAAAGLAWLLLAETFGPVQALGGAVVLAGIVICRLTLIRPEPTVT